MLNQSDGFAARHIGPRPDDTRAMLETMGYPSLDAFIDAVVPDDIRLRTPLDLPAATTHPHALAHLHPLPVGDLAGPARGVAQLPDGGRGPHGARDRQRIAAR